MEHQHQPRPGLCEFRPGQPTVGQTCSRKVPEFTTSATEAQGSWPQRSGEVVELLQGAFAFSQMNPLRDCHLWTHQTLRRHTRIFTKAYYLQPNNVSHVAVGRTMCRAGTKSARPFIAPSHEPRWGLTLIEPLRPYYIGSGRRSRIDGRKLSIPSTSRTLAARRGEPSTNFLAGLDARFTSAPSWQTPSPCNSWRTGHTGLRVHQTGQHGPVWPMEDSNTWGSQYLWTL